MSSIFACFGWSGGWAIYLGPASGKGRFCGCDLRLQGGWPFRVQHPCNSDSCNSQVMGELADIPYSPRPRTLRTLFPAICRSPGRHPAIRMDAGWWSLRRAQLRSQKTRGRPKSSVSVECRVASGVMPCQIRRVVGRQY